MKRFDGVNNNAGMFQDRNPAQAKLGSILDASWLNMVQSEVVNVIEGAGIVLDGNKTTQLSEAITKIIQDYSIAQKLPNPVLWAPLSGNLNLISGFNTALDTITVGGTDYSVAARMLSFSRSTTATYVNRVGEYVDAKINEPRFEKEGLLIEGRSTNLTFPSDCLDMLLTTARSTVTKITKAGIFGATEVILVSSDDQVGAKYAYPKQTTGFVEGDEVAVSAVIRILHPQIKKFRIGSNDFNTAATTYNVEPDSSIIRVSHASVVKAGSTSVRTYLWPRTDLDGDIVSQNEPLFEILHYQIEKNTKATSIIRTTTTAVTREPDILTVKQKNNINFGKELTVAFRFNLLGGPVNNPGGGSNIRRGLISLYPYTDAYMTIMMASNKFSMSHGSSTFSGDVTAAKSGVLAARTKDGINSCWLSGVKGNVENPISVPAGTNDYSADILIGYGAGATVAGARPIDGHISDLRIWDVGLTDIQMAGMV